ncbi:GTPase [Acidovorax sp. CCYZU-2555]|uniref:GTPase n=1 Tax=Acidovorax sp. CCYZU-2555 TaxID=2835042 RepID=UPI001BCE829A|nr:50S ribosome-binding GTPase [Acidovorax sp. CCYZU-2555]
MSGTDAEQQFMAGLDALQWGAGDMRATLGALDAWLERLAAGLTASPLQWPGLRADHALAAQASAIHARLQADVPDWQARRQDLGATQALAALLEHSAILLVFGKFNAGKSSFCNFVADRFAARGHAVEYFSVEAERIVPLAGARLKEGSTETTTTLQGVRLGRKLVLFDTPGLHSATPENAALTRRFTDSADGVLWLTSSTSPGQVQELDELARELHRGKPLQPVLTRSDCVEEDEVDGEIVSMLRNKTADNRALQEADVQQRGRDKLALLGVAPELLRPPVSVSSYAARDQGQTAQALNAAGFDRLWAALQQIVDQAQGYRQRKSAEIVLHHAEECVLQGLQTGAQPLLAALQQAISVERTALPGMQTALVTQVWRSVIPALPELLERHAPAGDARAVCAQAQALLEDAFAQAARSALSGYDAPVTLARPLLLGDDAAYERIGTGSAMVVDPARLHAALEQAIHGLLSESAAQALRPCQQALDALEASLQALLAELDTQRAALAAIKAGLRRSGQALQPAH